MAYVDIIESGMTFRVEQDKLYYIEKTNLYASLGDRIKRPEFMMAEDGAFIFVEAKQSSPRAKTETVSCPDPLRVWCEDVRDKFANALILFNTTRMHRHRDDAYNEIPQCCRNVNLQKADYRFYLVINGHAKDWLAPVLYRLKTLMMPMMKMWNIKDSAVKVINDQMARDRHLIV